MIWYPPSLADALCVDVESSAGDDWFWGMVHANAATVDWTLGKIDTETYLEKIEHYLQEPEPIDFVNEILAIYLPGVKLL